MIEDDKSTYSPAGISLGNGEMALAMGKTWKYFTPCWNFLSFPGFLILHLFYDVHCSFVYEMKIDKERKKYRKLLTFVFTFIFVTPTHCSQL